MCTYRNVPAYLVLSICNQIDNVSSRHYHVSMFHSCLMNKGILNLSKQRKFDKIRR